MQLSVIISDSQFWWYVLHDFRMEEMKDQVRKRMFKKHIVRKLTFAIADGLSIEVNMYALIRPTIPGAMTLLLLCYGCCQKKNPYIIINKINQFIIFRFHHMAWFCHKSSFKGTMCHPNVFSISNVMLISATIVGIDSFNWASLWTWCSFVIVRSLEELRICAWLGKRHDLIFWMGDSYICLLKMNK